MKSGCYLMAACAMGGLGTGGRMLDAKSWAVNQGYVRSDCYLLISGESLAQKISQHYGTVYHNGYSFGRNSHHFWLLNASGKEVFNAAGLGYR